MDANTVSAIAAVVGIPLTITIAWITMRSQAEKRRLSYEFVAGSHLLTRDVAHIGQGLEVRYNNRVVEDPYWLIVRIINTGRKAIDKTDFKEPIEIQVDRPIILAEVVKTGREEMKKPAVKFNANQVGIPGILFNRQDWLAVSILTSGEPVEKKVHVRAKDVEPSQEFKFRTYGDSLDKLFLGISFGLTIGLLIIGGMVATRLWNALAPVFQFKGPVSTTAGISVSIGVFLLAAIGGVFIGENLLRLFQKWESTRQEYLRVD
jgi:hypothetical protein